MTDAYQKSGRTATLLRYRQLQWSTDRSGMFLAMLRRVSEEAFSNYISSS